VRFNMSALVPRASRCKRRSFNWRHAVSSLSPQHSTRQGLLTHLAYSQLGGGGPAFSFLNCRNARLGGRPLDVAGDSAEGHAVVQRKVLRLASILIGAGQ
jgi:hypothetical protein